MNVSKVSPIIPPLTGVRFLAALLVFLFHYNPFRNSESGIGSFLNGIMNEMYMGVGFFFVLSGFLIAYNYFDNAAIDFRFYKKYMIRRVARIYPVYFTITTAYFIYWYLNNEVGKYFFEVYFLNITFLKGFSTKTWFSGIYQGWSLTVEETFYILAPLIFILIKRKFFFTQILFFIAFGCLLVLAFKIFPFEGFFSGFHFLFAGTFFGRCFEFFAGIALAIAVKKGTLPNRTPGILYTLIGIAGIFFCLVLMKEITIHFDGSHATSHPLGVVIHNFVLPVFAIVFYYGLIAERTLVQRVFSSNLLVLLGKSSYVFYLIHAGLLASLITNHLSSNIFIIFIVVQSLSILLYYTFELPANKFIRRLFSS
jgi:peptidoglycan/LPS O-acetylase OafA/YrhL